MPDKKEVKRLMGYAKKILDRRIVHKLKEVKQEDKLDAIHYSIKSKLNSDYMKLKHNIDKMKKQGRDVFFIEIKLNLLNSKTHLFTVTSHKRDFVAMRKLFKQVQGDLRNV